MGAATRSTCISLPGSQLLNVGGVLFVLASYPIVLTDGRRLVPDASGMAIGVLGSSSVDGEVTHCPPADLDQAITAATAAPRTAWQITRCAPNLAAIVEFNDPEPGSSYLAYVAGTWTFVGLGSTKAGCESLPETIREVCRVRDIFG